MKTFSVCLFYITSILLLILSGCQKKQTTPGIGKKVIVVTYSALASVVKELTGELFEIRTAIPNGLDPHEWEPSAKDMEAITKADLVVENGLGLEGGMEKALKQAKDAGVRFFTASDYITVRKVGTGEGIPGGDPDQAAGASDPHLWMDPLTVKMVVEALAGYIQTNMSADVSSNALILSDKLDKLDSKIKAEISKIPPEKRKLITGHESLGYFAKRYGFKLVGAIVPSLNSQAAVTAKDMAALKKLIKENDVPVVFTELDTPPKIAEILAKEAGIKSVSISTHSLPKDLSYFTFMKNLTDTIKESLK